MKNNDLILLAIATSTAMVISITPKAHAGSFPFWPFVSADSLPCDSSRFNCILLRERVNTFQGLWGTKPALQYCQERYGNNATVVWRLAMRWCATPEQY